MKERNHKTTMSQKLRENIFKRQKNSIRFKKRPSTMGRSGIRGEVSEALTVGKTI